MWLASPIKDLVVRVDVYLGLGIKDYTLLLGEHIEVDGDVRSLAGIHFKFIAVLLVELVLGTNLSPLPPLEFVLYWTVILAEPVNRVLIAVDLI